jgi:hypothetical protein
MTGVEIFNLILDYLKDNSSIWNMALDGEQGSLTEVPDSYEYSVGGAKIVWSSKFDNMFHNGLTRTSLKFDFMKKVPSSKQANLRIINFINDAGTDMGWFYPSCLAWIDNIHGIEFFINNLDKLIDSNQIGTHIDLEKIINDTPFLCYMPGNEDLIEYNLTKYGYVKNVNSCTEWCDDIITCNNTIVLSEIKQPELVSYYKLAMTTLDCYHQYIEFYHIIEYKFYEGLYKELTQLKNRNASQFYSTVKNKNGFNESDMFKYVMNNLAVGFIGSLNTTAIRTSYRNLLRDLGVELEDTDKNTWSFFLYKLRCGIVHAKEDEVLIERTSSNEYLLCSYVLPYMKDLCAYLIENN